MTITAKYPGKCKRCGGSIQTGEAIEWEKGSGASHVKCPEKKGDSSQGDPATPYQIGGGSGYGCRGWTVGQVVAAPKHLLDKGAPEWIIVVTTSKRYFREDGLSFGVGDDSGYTYGARCRAATPEEAAPMIEAQRVAQAKKGAVEDFTAIKKEIQAGERPDGENVPDGERWFDTQNFYGGGDWIVVGSDWIWYVANNGADGDNWGANNVRTGGAGAIGWRMPRTEEMVSRLTTIRDILAGKVDY